MEIFLSALLVAFIFTLVFSFGVPIARRPASLFIFLALTLVLVVWSLWVPPIGPAVWNIAWLDLFLVAILVALLTAAATPSDENRRPGLGAGGPLDSSGPSGPRKTEALRQYDEKQSWYELNMFFWAFAAGLIVLVVIGYVAMIPELTH